MKFEVVSSEAISKCLVIEEVMEACKQGLIDVVTKSALIPQRHVLPVSNAGGATLFKPGYVPSCNGLGLKVVSVRSSNPQQNPPLPSILGVILLVDEETGAPKSILDAATITAIRTAAASALATKELAKVDSKNLLIFGAGAQAKAHIEYLMAVRNFTHISISNRTPENAQTLIDWVKETYPSSITTSLLRTQEEIDSAVSNADVIVTGTNSSSPLFNGNLLKPGVHINAVGAYQVKMQEIDEVTVSKAKTIADVDPKEIFDTTGDYNIPLQKGLIEKSAILGQIGELLNGSLKVRESDQDITIYKSVGNAVLDIVTAVAVFKKAEELKLSQVCNL